jgi:hypothetical protein
MGFWDIMYYFGLPIGIAAMVFSLFASFWTNHTFKKYSQVHSTRGITAEQAAEEILRINSLSGSFGNEQSVSIERVAGNLTDHYSPKEKVLRLSDSVYGNTSVAAIGVAAHECGHAIQDSKGFIPNKIRSVLVPLANIGSRFGPYMAVIGFVITSYSASGTIGNAISLLGIGLFVFAVLFYLVTLPVELDASRRAIMILDKTDILTDDELSGARKVLRAAAMTYVAAVVASILTLLRLLAMRRRR